MRNGFRIGLVSVVAGLVGAWGSVNIASNYTKKIENVKSEIVSRSQFVENKVLEIEGNLDNYNKFLESEKRYSGIREEYDSNLEISGLKQELRSYENARQASGAGFFASGVVIFAATMAGCEAVGKRFKRKYFS